MNPSNFDWLDQLPTNDSNVDMTLQTLGMESNDLATNNIGDEQDIVKYLFDNAQFPMPAIPVNSPPHSDNGSNNSTTDGGSPISLTTATMNNNSTPAFDHSWAASLNPQPTFSVFETKPISHSTNAPPPPKPKPKPAKVSASRKMRIKKKREPIFVTESPQNAYKKRNKKSSGATLPPIDENEQHQQHQQQDSSSSPSSHFDDDDDDDVDLNESSLDKQHLTSKERRQLRNKISARNFRVRRKEYISQLENKVDEQDDEIDSLKLDNKRLTSLNEQLLQEVMELRLQLQQPALAQQQQQQQQPQPQAVAPPPHYQQQPGLTVSPTSSSSSDSNSPPDFMEALLDFSLFNNFDNNRNNTYLSHSLMPDFDLSHVLGDKLAHPPSSTQLEEHRELMTMYPLLAPTLASIVIRHTFSLHYFAYLSNTFPYDTTSSKHDTILDILHPDDWVTAATKHSDDGGDEDPDKNQGKLVSAHVEDRRRASKSSSNSNDDNDDATWTREFEQEVIQGHYAYYALMRLRGLSHDEIMRRCHACMERRKEIERQRRRKAATSCGKFQTLQAFTSVASALLRNPSRSPMIAEVIHETKACRMNPKKNKATLMVSAPFRAALRIGNGKS